VYSSNCTGTLLLLTIKLLEDSTLGGSEPGSDSFEHLAFPNQLLTWLVPLAPKCGASRPLIDLALAEAEKGLERALDPGQILRCEFTNPLLQALLAGGVLA
jgi:hypothetical protein